MNYNIPRRLWELKKRKTDLFSAVKNDGLPEPYIKLYPSEFSEFLNEKVTSPKSESILAAADKIVTRWEHDAG